MQNLHDFVHSMQKDLIGIPFLLAFFQLNFR